MILRYLRRKAFAALASGDPQNAIQWAAIHGVLDVFGLVGTAKLLYRQIVSQKRKGKASGRKNSTN